MKYLSSVLLACKIFFSITLKNVILQIPLVVVFIGTGVSAALLYQQMLNMSKYLKKTLIGGFSCVNTRLAFDTDILLNENKNKKSSI